MNFPEDIWVDYSRWGPADEKAVAPIDTRQWIVSSRS